MGCKNVFIFKFSIARRSLYYLILINEIFDVMLNMYRYHINNHYRYYKCHNNIVWKVKTHFRFFFCRDTSHAVMQNIQQDNDIHVFVVYLRPTIIMVYNMAKLY